MLFWIIATALSVVVAGLLMVPLLRAPGAVGSGQEEINIYRDQLAEVDRDLARGLLGAEDAERTRTEISRRLLAADKDQRDLGAQAPRAVTLGVAGVTGLAVVGGGLLTYTSLGAPGYPDTPLATRIAASEAVRANRMSQAQAEAAATPVQTPDFPEDYVASVAQLRALVPTRPDDIQGWLLLSQHEATLGNFPAAAAAQTRVIALRGDEVTNADREVLLTQMISGAQGFVSPEAEQVMREILITDPANLAARYYFGLLYFQTDRPDRAFQIFRTIIDEGRASPFTDLARASVEEAAFRTGVEYTLPPPSGPALADILAMGDLTETERMAMIEQMVATASTRLAEDGGTLPEWQRLIIGLSVLGNMSQAAEIYAEAVDLFGASDAARDSLRETALQAGITP